MYSYLFGIVVRITVTLLVFLHGPAKSVEARSSAKYREGASRAYLSRTDCCEPICDRARLYKLTSSVHDANITCKCYF